MIMATKKLQLGGLKRMADVVNAPVGQLREKDDDIRLDLIDIQRQVRLKMKYLKEFAEHLKVQGVKSAVILLALPNGRYRLIAGERRVRASIMAGLTTIPARIERDLTEREIRAIQVAENNQRENLTAYEQAMGVIEDVNKYGVKEAMIIWSRSESWVSKRVSVEKYDTRITKLMDDEVTDDLELLQTLNLILALKPDDFFALESRLRSEQPVTRDEARAKLAGIKAWMQEQEQLEHRKKQLAAAPATTERQVKEPAGRDTKTAGRDAAPSANRGEPVQRQAVAPTPAAEAEVVARNGHAEETTAAEPAPEELRQAFQQRLQAIYHVGTASRDLFEEIKTDLESLGCTKDQTDWTIWSGFLSIALPILTASGPARTASIMQRLQSELKRHSAAQLWDNLHPEASGTESGRQEVAVMPQGWRL